MLSDYVVKRKHNIQAVSGALGHCDDFAIGRVGFVMSLGAGGRQAYRGSGWLGNEVRLSSGSSKGGKPQAARAAVQRARSSGV